MSFEKRIAQYVRLRDHIKAEDEAHKVKMRPFRDLMGKLEAELLKQLEATGQDSAATAAGTAYRSKREYCSLEDASEFMRHVIGSEDWDLLDRKANTAACVKFAEENGGNMPPGVKYTAEFVANVRRK
jgi:hypothetical protein